MNLTATAEQKALADSAAAVLARACPPVAVREAEASAAGFSAALWRQMAGLGWPGIALPEAVGGAGAGVVELAILAETMGRFAVSSPLLPVTLAAWSILWAGSDQQQASLLPALASGELIATVALAEPDQRNEWAPPALRGHGGAGHWTLAGTKALVPFAGSAQRMVAPADLDGAGPSLVLIDLGRDPVRMRRNRSLGGDPLYEVSLDGVSVTAEDVLGHRGEAEQAVARILNHAALLQVCYAVGLSEAALELSVRHVGTRQQFGKPIGAFQAVAHRCADMRTSINACRYLALKAAAKLQSSGDAPLEVSVAKAYANEEVRQVFLHAHQVHGAMGYSMEYDLQLFTRRAKAFELTCGSASFHRSRVASEIGL